MTWLLRVLLVSCVLQLCSIVYAEDKEIFVGHVALVLNWRNEEEAKALFETFKHRLRDHGYQTNDCRETQEGWHDIIQRSDGAIPYDEIDKQLVATAECEFPTTAKHVYSARLILDYDPQLKRRQASLYLLPLTGGSEKLDGTYTHKQDMIERWYVVIDGVITRAIGRYNEETSIRVVMPKEGSVGDVVRLDATEAWDPDGEAFELRWNIRLKACVGKDTVLPRNKNTCPKGTTLQDWAVRDRAGKSRQVRELSIPMVGDYKIQVYSKVGRREEPVRRFTVRALPRRDWAMTATYGLLRLPTYFMGDLSDDSSLALVTTIGVDRRFVHRLGWLGWHEEVHYALSLSHLNDFGTPGEAIGASIEAGGRTLDRTGSYGVVNALRTSLLFIEAARSFDDEHFEWGQLGTFFIGGYYALGNNYIFEHTQFCSDVCPSFTIGPTMTAMYNYTHKRFGLGFGLEFSVVLEF
jgi:hypothetical protein